MRNTKQTIRDSTNQVSTSFLNLSEPSDVVRYSDITVGLSDIIHECDVDFHRHDFENIYVYDYDFGATEDIYAIGVVTDNDIIMRYQNLEPVMMHGPMPQYCIYKLRHIKNEQDGYIIYFFPEKGNIFVVRVSPVNLDTDE